MSKRPADQPAEHVAPVSERTGAVEAVEVTPENDGAPAEATDSMEILMLGAGQEVGRSCCLLNFRGKSIMVSPQPNHAAENLFLSSETAEPPRAP